MPQAAMQSLPALCAIPFVHLQACSTSTARSLKSLPGQPPSLSAPMCTQACCTASHPNLICMTSATAACNNCAVACRVCICRNAGEMKGVTMEENKQQLAALKRLLDLPHNKQCADCVGGGGAARASWASINTGVFICMRCAGIHRGLGVHVSKVRRPLPCHRKSS